jgi:Zn-dependent peptidase ImmA (M78 family)
MSIVENESINHFVQFAKDRLKLNNAPEISLSYDDVDPVNPTLGSYDFANKVICVNVKNRLVADILRTIAHELVHVKQDELGTITNPELDGKTGSNIENQANTVAGILMREYGKLNEKIYTEMIEGDKYSKLKEIIRKMIHEMDDDELDEMTGTAATPGYQTPYAFSKKSQIKKKNKKLTDMGFTIVKMKEAIQLPISENDTKFEKGKWYDVAIDNLSDEVVQNVFDLYKDVYDNQKLELLIKSSDELRKGYKMVILTDQNGDNKIDAFFLYKNEPGYGNKISLLGSIEFKSALITKMIDLLSNGDHFFTEVSGRPEEILRKAIPDLIIRDKDFIEKMFGNKLISLCCTKDGKFDGYYKRKIGSSIIAVKRMFGKPKGLK